MSPDASVSRNWVPKSRTDIVEPDNILNNDVRGLSVLSVE